MKSTSVLFVCLGNICRSPLAHGLFQSKVNARGLADRVHVDSCGTSAYHVGEPPDPGSIQVAREVGVDISRDRARQVTRDDMASYDWIIAMDRSNKADLLRIAPAADAKIHLMRSFEDAPDDLDVPDPWGGGIRGFERVRAIVDTATESLLERVVASLDPEA